MRIAIIVFFLAMSAGCSDSTVTPALNVENSDTESGETMSSSATEAPEVLAYVGQTSITQAEIDQSIELQLFELEWAAYELRRQALAETIQNKQSAESDPAIIHVLIEPPIPPRLTLPERALPMLGNDLAPVTISVFCNYQSSHCLRMHPVYEELHNYYPGKLKFEFYELPLAFHRNAFGASVAAYCASSMGQFEGFHRALWSASDSLNQETYKLTAAQLGMDPDRYAQCMDSSEVSAQVKQNIALAAELGFKNVPVTLVNGLYLKGPKDVDVLRFMVDHELRTVGNVPATVVASDKAVIDETALKLRLEGVLLGDDETQFSAMIQFLDVGETGIYKRGQTIQPSVELNAIHAEYVLLDNNGKLERLSLAENSEQRAANTVADVDDTFAAIERATIASGNVLDSDEPPPPGLEYQYRGVVAPAGEKPLSRSWVDAQLEHKESLLSHFQPTELDVEGVNIMRLENIAENEFYKTLGLQENDVVMRVNGEWNHEQNNMLLSHLETSDEISLVLMRRGLPVHYAYKIN